MIHPQKTNGCSCHNNNGYTSCETPGAIESSLKVTKKTARALPSVLLSILIAFFPKCPACWAVYMSMFGSLGLAKLPYMRWLLPVLVVFLGLHLYLLYRKAGERGYLPFMVSVAGAALIVTGRFFFPWEQWLIFTGMAFIISGSLLNNLTFIRLPLTTSRTGFPKSIHH